MSDEQETVMMEYTFWPIGGDLNIRTVGVGLTPVVLIEPTEDADGVLYINVDASGLTPEELVSMLQWTLKELEDNLDKVVQV